MPLLCRSAVRPVQVLDVRATSDDALPSIVQHLHQLGGTSPDSASMQAASAAAKAAAASRRQRTLEQQEEQARAAQEEQCTPTRAGGRRKRNSGSARGSPVDCAGAFAAAYSQPCAAEEAGSPSYAELASMDSAAAAALSLPAAVQKHFAQKQLQLQLGSNGVQHGSSNGVKLEADSEPRAAPQQPAPPAAAPVASTPASRPSAGLPAVPGSEQQLGGLHSNGFQQLLGQMQAVHALQAALAGTVPQQQPAAAVAGSEALPAASPLLAAAAAGFQMPQAGAQLPGVGSVLAAVLARQQAAAALQASQCLSAPLPLAQQPAASNPLAAAAALLASSPATASLLLSNPTMLAAVAAACAANGLGNGASAAQPLPAAAAAHMHDGAATGDAGGLAVQNGIHQPVSPTAAEVGPPMQPMSADGVLAAVGAAAAAVPKAEPRVEPEEQ